MALATGGCPIYGSVCCAGHDAFAILFRNPKVKFLLLIHHCTLVIKTLYSHRFHVKVRYEIKNHEFLRVN